jgi:hypothetical protein
MGRLSFELENTREKRLGDADDEEQQG